MVLQGMNICIDTLLIKFSIGWPNSTVVASKNGHVDIVKELYQACANINACDKVC